MVALFLCRIRWRTGVRFSDPLALAPVCSFLKHGEAAQPVHSPLPHGEGGNRPKFAACADSISHARLPPLAHKLVYADPVSGEKSLRRAVGSGIGQIRCASHVSMMTALTGVWPESSYVFVPNPATFAEQAEDRDPSR
jgi:hypothetical protein